MHLSKPTLLFLIILIEGYVVLATELLAIRSLVPFVGSGTEVISIIISAVLLPLALGYHYGGRVKGKVRARLLSNAMMALAILTYGLSYFFLEVFFNLLKYLHITHPVQQAFFYALLFLSWPVFLLGQTVPLVSNYFGRKRLSEITGRMLFFSTVGSFGGSVFSTLVLMNTIGVHWTVVVTLSMLGALILLLMRRRISLQGACVMVLLGLVLLINSPMTMQAMHVVSDNSYNTVSVYDDAKDGGRMFNLNRSSSSLLGLHGERLFPYIKFIERNFIATSGDAPRDFLVIGAGGFTVGLDDTKNHYLFVDIDPKLKEIAEKEFLPKPLTPNKRFVASSARAFLRQKQQYYDMIFIDTYTHIYSVPMETTTVEFLRAAKHLLKPGGVLVVNQIATADFKDRFSKRYDRGFAEVFGTYTRQVIGDFNPWKAHDQTHDLHNVMYIYYDRPLNGDTVLYTDDLNTYSLDRH